MLLELKAANPPSDLRTSAIEISLSNILLGNFINPMRDGSSPKPKILHADNTYAVETLNQFGCQFNYNDEYVEGFLEYARTDPGTIGDLGCGFGAMTKRLLEAGATHVIANDLSKDHLDILLTSLQESDKAKVQLKQGSALDLAKDIPANSLAGIFAGSWLHFLRPEEVRQALKMFFNLIKPSGKLCVITVTCYSDVMTAQDVVAERKKAGAEWPGLWTKELYDGPFTHHLPDFMLCLDPDVLEREVKAAGFEVDKAGYIDFKSVFEAITVDGREFAGIPGNQAISNKKSTKSVSKWQHVFSATGGKYAPLGIEILSSSFAELPYDFGVLYKTSSPCKHLHQIFSWVRILLQ